MQCVYTQSPRAMNAAARILRRSHLWVVQALGPNLSARNQPIISVFLPFGHTYVSKVSTGEEIREKAQWTRNLRSTVLQDTSRANRRTYLDRLFHKLPGHACSFFVIWSASVNRGSELFLRNVNALLKHVFNIERNFICLSKEFLPFGWTFLLNVPEVHTQKASVTSVCHECFG